MVWTDMFNRLTNRPKWNNNKKAAVNDERSIGLCCSCCSTKDQMPIEQIEEAFAISQWQQLPHWFFVSFRCVAALYFTTWLVTSWISFKDTHKGGFSKWFVFITNWSFALLVLQACTLAWPVLSRKVSFNKDGMQHMVMLDNNGVKEEETLERLKETEEEEEEVENKTSNPTKNLDILHRIMWTFDNIASTMAIGVTIAFWAFLYNRQQPPNMVTVHTHGINAVYVMLDQLLCRRPRRLIHFYQPIIFGLVYVLFSLVYWRLGGTDPAGRHFVYPFLDWEKPVKSVLFAFVFSVVAAAVIYLFLYAIYRFRTFAHRKIVRTNIKHNAQLDNNVPIVI